MRSRPSALSRSDSLRKEKPRPSPSPSPSREKGRQTERGRAQGFALPSAYDGTLRLFLVLWLYRAVNACLVKTYFHPDEFWQSLEVAHVAVFGYGALCWETLQEIRGFSFPALFTPVYGLLKLLGLDHVRWLFIHLPGVTVCAATAAGGDFATYCLAKQACGGDRSTAAVALLLSVCSWFNWYCAVRPLSNPIESTLCAAALCFWPMWGALSAGDRVEVERSHAKGDGGHAVVVGCEGDGTYAVKYLAGGPREKGLDLDALSLVEAKRVSLSLFGLSVSLTSRQVALLLAAVAVIMRPTCLTMWLCLGLHQLCVLPAAEKPTLVIESVAIGLSVLTLSAVVDCWWYGHWVLPQLNFMGFNMLSQGAQRYGKHPGHWYLSRAAPAILGSYLLPFGAALLDLARGGMETQRDIKGCRRLLVLSSIVVGLYSTQAHKEYRFILPALPLLLIVIAQKLVRESGRQCYLGLQRRVLGLLLLAQLPPAVYFSAYHMRGGQAVMDALHSELSAHLADRPGAELSVGFLTACHMTPWQAQLHMDIPVHFPDCSPSKTAGCRKFSDQTCAIAQRRWPTAAEMGASASTDDGTDEMTHMFADPLQYARDTYGAAVTARWGGLASPSHLVMFEPMATAVAEFLHANGYAPCVTVESGNPQWLETARDLWALSEPRMADPHWVVPVDCYEQCGAAPCAECNATRLWDAEMAAANATVFARGTCYTK